MTDEYDPMNPEEGHFERAFNFIAFDEDSIGFEESSRLFNEWLNEERAKAWDSGAKAMMQSIGDTYGTLTFIAPENPYRKADQ